jgi:hypothetical protein
MGTREGSGSDEQKCLKSLFNGLLGMITGLIGKNEDAILTRQDHHQQNEASALPLGFDRDYRA